MIQYTTVVPKHKYPWYIWLFAIGIFLTVFFAFYELLPQYFNAALYLKRAESQIKAKHIDKSIESYSKVLSIIPDCKEAKIGIAYALFLTKFQTNHKKALGYLADITLPSSVWKKLSSVMPLEYQSHFVTKEE